MLDGEPIRTVAADTPFTYSSAQRHVRNHLRADLLSQVRRSATATLHVVDFGDRLLALADEAARVRAAAHDGRTKLLSIREERESVSLLLTRLGVDSEESLETVREAQALASAISYVLRDEPRVAAALSRHLSDRGENDLASAFLRLSETAAAEPKELTA